jgi:light-regulated signal transduction histidine kinase (bacteriophytochrome)
VTTYIAVVVTLALVGVVYNGVSGYLFRSRKELTIAHVLEAQSQLWDVLQLVKVQAESARVNRKEANITKEETSKVVDRVAAAIDSKTEELKTEIVAVPERVRAALDPDSGTHKSPKPAEGQA